MDNQSTREQAQPHKHIQASAPIISGNIPKQVTWLSPPSLWKVSVLYHVMREECFQNNNSNHHTRTQQCHNLSSYSLTSMPLYCSRTVLSNQKNHYYTSFSLFINLHGILDCSLYLLPIVISLCFSKELREPSWRLNVKLIAHHSILIAQARPCSPNKQPAGSVNLPCFALLKLY